MEQLFKNKSPNSGFGLGDRIEAEVIRNGKVIEAGATNNAVNDGMGLSANVKMEVSQEKE